MHLFALSKNLNNKRKFINYSDINFIKIKELGQTEKVIL